MALSLGPHKPEQVRDTSTLFNITLLSYSTPRQFTTPVPDPKTLPMSKTRSPLPASNFRNVTQAEAMDSGKLSSIQLLSRSDLPSWTPLRIQALGGNNDSSVSDSEADVDELSVGWPGAGSTLKRPQESPTDIQTVTVANAVPTKQTLKPSSSSTKSSGRKTARFEGVVITTKPPRYKKNSSRKKPGPAFRSNTRVSTSLVVALAKTFDANRYTESPVGRPHAELRQHDGDRSAVPQTDVETTTDAENDRFQLNARLVRRHVPRAPGRTAVAAHVSETNSEEATPPILQQGLVPQPERPVKRLKIVQYESNAALIDAALGTVEAPIGWDAELDFITREEDFVTHPVQTVTPPASADMRMAVDEGDFTPGRPKTANPAAPARAGWRTRTRGVLTPAVLSPYLSHGARFRQRLDTIFGENATVRTDRAARPRSIEYDFYAPFHERDRAPSPGTSDSIMSVNFASTAEEGASAIPSTRVTSQSPKTPSSDVSVDRLPGNRSHEASSMRELVFDANEEQMIGWITALQRLIKGKVHVKEEDLEKLSIIIAEIESVKDSLGNISVTSELCQTVKQLAELPEIPFGDRNKLRERAKHIFQTWPSATRLGAS